MPFGGICILRFIIVVLNCTFPLLFRINRSSDSLLKIGFVLEIVPMEWALSCFFCSCKDTGIALLSSEGELFIKWQVNAGYLELSSDSLAMVKVPFLLGLYCGHCTFSLNFSNDPCKLRCSSHVLLL